MRLFSVCLLGFLSFLSSLASQESTNSFWWPWGEEEPPVTTPLFADVLNLEERLNQRVIGQPWATRALANAIIAYNAKIHDSNRPIGCFLFVGTTGVGKTELAKAIAQEMPSDCYFLRLNMSEFNNDRVGLDRLIGLPWGYMQNHKGGELSNAILEHPFSVVLLDEFEKADQKVKYLFLQIFDEGYFTSAKREYVDCKNCIFIATSNLGSEGIAKGLEKNLTPDETLHLIEPTLTSGLSPELYARMEPILFQPITKSVMKQIVCNKLKELANRVYEKRHIEVVFDLSVEDYVMSQCGDLKLGARPILGIIRNEILTVIAKAFVNGSYDENDRLFISHDGQRIIISRL